MRFNLFALVGVSVAGVLFNCAGPSQEIRSDYKGKSYPNEVLWILKADQSHFATWDSIDFASAFPGIAYTFVPPIEKVDTAKPSTAGAKAAKTQNAGTSSATSWGTSSSSSSLAFGQQPQSLATTSQDTTKPASAAAPKPKENPINDRTTLAPLIDSTINFVVHGTKWVWASADLGGDPISAWAGDKALKISETFDDKPFVTTIPAAAKGDARFVLVPIDVAFMRNDQNADDVVTVVDTAKGANPDAIRLVCKINYLIYDYQARQTVALGRADGAQVLTGASTKADWAAAAEAAIRKIFTESPFAPQQPKP